MNQQPAEAMRQFGEAAEEAWATIGEVEQRNAQRRRLEAAVIEAAKADRESETRKEGEVGIDRMIAARRTFRAAVAALMEFESEHVGEQE